MPTGLDVLLASGPDGTLFLSIPRAGGSVLALFDRDGRPRPGWPIAIGGSISCRLLLALEDGSVRAVCDRSDRPDDVWAFAFDSIGRSLPGWPVRLPAGYQGAGRVVNGELTVFAGWSVTTVAEDGSIRRGVRSLNADSCCDVAIAPDGVAYAVVAVSGWVEGSAERTRITALDQGGVRPGWPIDMDGIASGASFGPDDRIVVVVGSLAGDTSRVVVFDRQGKSATTTSAKIPVDTAEGGVDCVIGGPEPPVIGADGTITVFSELDTAVFALDKSLKVKPGWPYRPARPLAYPGWNDPRYELNCPAIERPVLGPDGTLYLPLQARNETIGQSIVAVRPDGRARPGWPVELQRAGAEFWSVVVGSDGTVYALAAEPEAGGTYSATILAIAADSTVLYRTTIIDP